MPPFVDVVPLNSASVFLKCYLRGIQGVGGGVRTEDFHLFP